MSEKTQYQPPFTITSTIVNLVAEISEAVGRLTIFSGTSKEKTDFSSFIEFMLRMILNAITSATPQLAPQVTPQVGRLLEVIQGEMTIPGKPNSRLQKYRLTDKGQRWLQEHGDKKGK